MDEEKPQSPAARTALAFAKSQAYQDAADAPATLRAYASDVKNFSLVPAKWPDGVSSHA